MNSACDLHRRREEEGLSPGRVWASPGTCAGDPSPFCALVSPLEDVELENVVIQTVLF